MLLARCLVRSHATSAAYAAASFPSALSRAFHFSPARYSLDMEKVNTTERLAELRKLMKERQIDVYSAYSSFSPLIQSSG